MQWFSKKGFMVELGLHCISFSISKNYALELNFLHFVRKFSDGIIYLKFETNSDLYIGDHNPQFYIQLIFLNIMLLEFRIYNINHVEPESQDGII